LVICVKKVAAVIRYAAGGGFHGGEGFAEPGAGGGVGELDVILRPESDLPRQVKVVVRNRNHL